MKLVLLAVAVLYVIGVGWLLYEAATAPDERELWPDERDS